MSRLPCPACATPGGAVLATATFARIDAPPEHPGGPWRPTDTLDGYAVTACPSCGLVSGRGTFDQAQLDRYYARLSKYTTHATEPPHDAARFAHVAAFLDAQGLSHDTPIIELGSTTGGFLAAARDRGYSALAGIEPDAGSAAMARARGLDVTAGTLSGLTERLRGPHPPAVGALVLLHVLEHVVDLAGFVALLDTVLPADGALFVEVPDASRFDLSDAIPFQQFSVEHVNFFSAASLARLFAPIGLQPVGVFQVDREVGRAWPEPAVGVLFRRGGADVRLPDDDAPAAIARYVARSTLAEAPIRRTIDTWSARRAPFLLWSVGTQALRLLATSALSTAPIAAFIDGNPRYAGHRLLDRPILPPAALRDRTEPILIATTGYTAPILHHLRAELRYPHEVGVLDPGAA